MTYTIRTRVVAVQEQTRVQGVYATAEVNPATGKPLYEEVRRNLGWFVTFEGSHESLYVGDSHPTNERGDKVRVGDQAEIALRFF